MHTAISRRQAMVLGASAFAVSVLDRPRRLHAVTPPDLAHATTPQSFARNLGPLPRHEGQMLRGNGIYTDDVHFEAEAYGHVLRSPHPHARIRSIDTNAARCAPGVLAVLTGAEIASMAKPLPCVVPPASYGGNERLAADRPILAIDRVRHVGDGVAFIVAETQAQAQAAASLVEVDYEVLPACVEPRVAKVDVPIWPAAPDNLGLEWRFGDANACRKLFDAAAHVVRLNVLNPRVAPHPIEARAAIGLYERGTGRLTLVANTQGVHFVRGVLTKALGLPAKKLRVVTPNVGGAFGSKIYAYPEHALVLLTARTLGRPVRWTCGRDEAFLSDTQGRGHTTEAALALDKQGRFLALSVKPTVDLGAYLSQLTPLTATVVGAPVQGGVYRFKALEIVVRGVFTNKVPMDAYRGAGRPEATYVLERLIDRAAAELGIDPAELRARNLPPAQSNSLTTVTGLVIDGGRFSDNQRRCLELADRAGFATRRTEAARRGRLRGFGFANYLEANGGLQIAAAIKPGSGPVESAALRFGTGGIVDVTIGTESSGQNHDKPVKLYLAGSLGLSPAAITVREGDSDALLTGAGTGGSKSLLTGSVAMRKAVEDVVAQGRTLMAGAWDVDAASIDFARGIFSVPASNRRISVTELAARYPGALDTQAQAALMQGSSANGCHACEVEIDPATGTVTVERYTAVDDFGRVVNEPAVRGQVQGGVAQGIGQALLELAPAPDVLAHPTTTSSFGYTLPRAVDVPPVTWANNGLTSRTNMLGAKACGESGASAAPPTVMNAIVNALAGYGEAWSLQMPARPQDVWRVLQSRPNLTASLVTEG